ncbi:hypothetical protein BJ978_002080 [Agromyces terreus]|uniref:Iron ABC transporter ATP-binding protein n=1 Tax=Agromyces terreus TaxID=424795 RepID=A0A9X2H7K0_9MICO|nr:iron ABC transporter ATP-binding protein [Agromyces terreus]MCP2371404.1 hypothetical protein [Agromyces terreus]
MSRPVMNGIGRPFRPIVASFLLVAASAALLSGCAAGDPTATSTADGTDVPVQSTEPATPSAEPDPAIPFAIECDTLLTPEQLYAFNPNYGVAPDYAPSARTVATLVEEHEGTSCGYLNQTSGDVIEIAVATPSESAATTLANDAAAASTAVPTYGTPPEVSGYFTRSGENGQVQVFTGPYWVVVDSTAFFEPGDAQTLVADVLANLPAS